MKLLFSDGTTVEVEGAKVPESFAEDGSDVFPVPECIFTYNPRFFEKEVEVSDEEWVKFLDFAHYLHWNEKFFSLILNFWNSRLEETDHGTPEEEEEEKPPSWWILKKEDASSEEMLTSLIGEKHYFQEVVNIFKFLRRCDQFSDAFQFEWETPSLLPFVVFYEKTLHSVKSMYWDGTSHFFDIFKRAFFFDRKRLIVIPPLVDLVHRLLPAIGEAPQGETRVLNTCVERLIIFGHSYNFENHLVTRTLMSAEFALQFPELRREMLSRKWSILLLNSGKPDLELESGLPKVNFFLDTSSIFSFFEEVRGGRITFLTNKDSLLRSVKIDGRRYSLVLGEPDQRGNRVVEDFVVSEVE